MALGYRIGRVAGIGASAVVGQVAAGARAGGRVHVIPAPDYVRFAGRGADRDGTGGLSEMVSLDAGPRALSCFLCSLR